MHKTMEDNAGLSVGEENFERAYLSHKGMPAAMVGGMDHDNEGSRGAAWTT
jgi:hypothetical protein